MTFSEILLDVYDRTGNDQSPLTAVSRRIKRYVNRWNRKILSAPGMESLRRATIPKSSIADQPTYGVALQAIRWMSEAENQRRIFPKTLGWYRENFPDPANFTGTPSKYIPLGHARIHTAPSAPCELFAVSSAAGDVGTIKVEAIRSDGYRASLSKALTGIVPVSLSAVVTDVIDIENVYLSAAQTGDVTLTQGSVGAELTKIRIGQTAPRFLRYALAPTPSDAIVYTLDGIAEIVDMANDNDEPFIEADFHDILVDGGVYDEWMNRGRVRDAKELRFEIEARVRQLRASILEWPEEGDDQPRTFDETISEPTS